MSYILNKEWREGVWMRAGICAGDLSDMRVGDSILYEVFTKEHMKPIYFKLEGANLSREHYLSESYVNWVIEKCLEKVSSA